MSVHLLTYSNLFPSSGFPHHGLFVKERMVRLSRRNGWRLTVVAPLPRSLPLPGRLGRTFSVPLREEADGVVVHHPRYLHVPGLPLGRQWRAMAGATSALVRDLVRSQGVDVVDAHYLYPDACAALAAAREAGVPCLVTARGSDVTLLPRHPAVASTLRAVVPGAAGWMAVSADLARRMAEATGVPLEKVVVVPSGVDLERFRPGDRLEARRRLGLPEDGRLVLAVGRLDPVKGLDLLLEAFAAFPAGEDRLLLVGEGPERRRLEGLAGARGLAGRVLMPGAMGGELLPLAYHAADVFVLASRREGWPNVVLEALACGLPVVARAVGGVPEILDGVRCWLVDQESAAALAGALARALEEGASWDPMVSRRRAEELGWEPTLARLTAVVQGVVR